MQNVAGPECPRIEGSEAVLEQFADILSDESKLSAKSVDRVFLPETADQAASAVRDITSAGRHVTVSGGRTGIVGGAVPLGSRDVISLQNMKRFRGVVIDNSTGMVTADIEAGITLAELDTELSKFDWASLGIQPHFYPVDPTENTAEVGGTIATNASGARSYRYGSTRENVQGVDMIFHDGSSVSAERGQIAGRDGELRDAGLFDNNVLKLREIPRPSCRCATGFVVTRDVDLVDLMTGSEGTLGIISGARLRLSVRPTNVLTLLCYLPAASDPYSLVKALRGDKRLSVLAVEYFDPTSLNLLRQVRDDGNDRIPDLPADAASAVLFEQDYADDEQLDEYITAIDEILSSCGGSIDDTWAGDDDAEREKLRTLRHGIPEAVNNRIAGMKREIPSLHKVGTDLAVPDDRFEELMAIYRTEVPRTGLEHVIFGHAGENHLHVNFIPHSEEELSKALTFHEELARRVVAMGGSVTAEHGVGRLKRKLLAIQYGDEGVESLRDVKRFFDPKGLFNPGVLFESGESPS